MSQNFSSFRISSCITKFTGSGSDFRNHTAIAQDANLKKVDKIKKQNYEDDLLTANRIKTGQTGGKHGTGIHEDIQLNVETLFK